MSFTLLGFLVLGSGSVPDSAFIVRGSCRTSPNRALRTSNSESNLNTNQERRTQKRERFLIAGVAAAATLLGACSSAQPPASASTPDFTGVWAGPGFVHTGNPDTDKPQVRLYTEKNMAPLKPGGRERLYRPYARDVLIDDPTAVCLPNGLTRQIPSPYAQQWIQTPTQLVILYEYMHFFRVIPFGPANRPHAADIEPTYMGDSIAWWDGDTLVIDTIGLKEWMLDAYHPDDGGSRWHSDQMHVVERLRLTDANNASYEVTIDDPAIFEKPWTETWSMQRKPNWKILENVCEDNNRCIAGNCTPADVQQSASR